MTLSRELLRFRADEDGDCLVPTFGQGLPTLMPHAGAYDVRWRGYREGARTAELGDEAQAIVVHDATVLQAIELIPPPAVLEWLKGGG